MVIKWTKETRGNWGCMDGMERRWFYKKMIDPIYPLPLIALPK
jgi:hypothetical protein